MSKQARKHTSRHTQPKHTSTHPIPLPFFLPTCDSVNAYEMDPHYIKAYLRAAEAHLALNERATVKLAVQELQEALKRDEDNEKIKALLKDAQLTWEADFD